MAQRGLLANCVFAVVALMLQAWLSSGQKMTGEFGQEVLGCACKGGKATHGYCGYHFHFGSSEDKPWCRTKYSCGHQSIKGSWDYCDERATERRRGNDGTLYTSKEWRDHYKKDGKDLWKIAEEYVERRQARNRKAYSVYEFRDFYVDLLGETGWIEEWKKATGEEREANDGKWYTYEQFVDFYGASKAWEQWKFAKPSRSPTEL
mmetsp:Transcript_89085/g.191160  ORF Transcript_89085/g.191160 Transcript_89085/m.191160 type:complete len:205 (-) Transcript_89085:134-748(-)